MAREQDGLPNGDAARGSRLRLKYIVIACALLLWLSAVFVGIAGEARVPRESEVRVGSATKTYTAIVVLQLVEEGLVELDKAIDSYLPGVAFALRDVYRSPRTMLELALARPAAFPAGERYEYSNTGYVVLGLMIEQLTLRPLHEQMQQRITESLELEHTYSPAPGEREPFTVTATALPWAIFDGPEEELLKRYTVVIDTLDRAVCAK